MKTKFLPKLLLLSLFCVSLNSCTAEEILNYTQGATATTSTTSTTIDATATTDGTTTADSTTIADPYEQPVVPKPR
jgi:hypothetical protein